MMAYVKSRRSKPKPEEFQETIESNKIVNHVPRNRGWFISLKGNPSEENIDELINQMRNYIKQQGAFEVQGFLREKDIPHRTWLNLLEAFPRIKEAYTEMKIDLGYNQRQAVRYGLIDKTFSVMSMHVYDKEYDEINKYHSALRKDEAQKSAMLFVEGYSRIRKDVENERSNIRQGNEETHQVIETTGTIDTKDIREEKPVD